MTPKQFYDWQTKGGTNDVMRLIDCLERADISWCAIRGLAVNHWAEEPMVTRDVDFVVAAESVEEAIKLLEEAGFNAKRFAWSVNFSGQSKVSIQLSTEAFYHDFPSRSVPSRHSWHTHARGFPGRHPAGKNQGMARCGSQAK